MIWLKYGSTLLLEMGGEVSFMMIMMFCSLDLMRRWLSQLLKGTIEPSGLGERKCSLRSGGEVLQTWGVFARAVRVSPVPRCVDKASQQKFDIFHS
jgi:hypothetical protein